MGSSTGKTIRLRRVIDAQSGSSIIFAIDHGMTSPRFLGGLENSDQRIREAVAGGANVLMMSRGLANAYSNLLTPTTSLALMLTASAAGRPGGPRVTPIGSVEEAARIGADAVVVYTALAGENEPEMIRYLSDVGEACDRLGMPLIAEAEFPDAYQMDSSPEAMGLGPDYLKRNVRLCCELGADLVKVNWSGSADSFVEVVRASIKPVVIAGGPVVNDMDLLRRMEAGRECGAIGCSVGRNIFEHSDPYGITRALCRIFKDRWSAERALRELSGGADLETVAR